MAETAERQRTQKKKRKWWLWLTGLLILVALLLVGIYSSGIMPGFSSGDPAEKAKAESALRDVIKAAETYRSKNDGVYEGMTAAKLKDSVSKVEVVDGMPKAGEVGITDYNSQKCILVYVGKSGRTYIATDTDGSIEFNF